MKLVVQKYGGTSVGDIDRIKNVAKRVVSYKQKGCQVVCVVSALSGTTDRLIGMANQISDCPPERELDMLLSTGEQVSVALLAMAIEELGYRAISFTGAQVGIITDSFHTKARILSINGGRLMKELQKGKVVIVAGFQGTTISNDITTLGRGGSDLTAVALAKKLKADQCEIYTDVEGVYTADPRIVPNARKINRISYDEMLEMASLGAKVMQARSIEMAKKFDVEIQVRSSFNNNPGTVICKEVKDMENVVVSGITLQRNEAKLTVRNVPDKPGVAAKIFKEIADNNVNVDMIVQNISNTGTTDMSFTVVNEDLNKAKKVLALVAKKIDAGDIIEDREIAKISVVGVGMKSHAGVASKMFCALASGKINIEMISTSEIKISCIIKKEYADKAVRLLHETFDLGKKSQKSKK